MEEKREKAKEREKCTMKELLKHGECGFEGE
jgi:hypothetical protein